MKLKSQPPNDGSELELAPALVPMLAVGLTNVPGGVVCLDKTTVAYPVGRCIATYSSDSSKVGMSEARREVRHITAITVSPDGCWVAAAEAMSNNLPAQVTLLDVHHNLERSYILTAEKPEDFTCVSFSGDGQLLVAGAPLNHQPATAFHVWDWKTSHHPTSSGTAQGFAKRVSVNPRFTSNVFIQCSNSAYYMRLTSSGQYRPYQLEGVKTQAETQFVDHTWLSDGRLALALSDKRVLLIDGVAVQHQVMLSAAPSCLAALPDGSLMAAVQRGVVELLRPVNTTPGAALALSTTIKPPNRTDEAGGSLDQEGRHPAFKAMCVDASGDVAALHAPGLPIMMLDHRLVKGRTVADGSASGGAVWRTVLPAFHSAAIVCASLAMRKDYLVTASEDLTVRVWCWRPPVRLVALHACHHSPLAVGIDPLGTEVVVTYVDCVKLYSVVEGMLLEMGSLQLPAEGGKPAQELTKCSHASWSPTGHLLAIVGGPALRDVFIFSPMHRSLVAKLSGHYTQVQDLAWSHDGLYLASASEGSVNTWHMEDFSKWQENPCKGWFNTAICCTRDFSKIVVGDASSGMRMLGASRVTGLARPGASRDAAGQPGAQGHDTPGLGVTALAEDGTYSGIVHPAHRAMQVAVTSMYTCCVAGGARGSIRVCDLPPTSPSHYQEYVPHTADISSLLAHYEGQWVITTDVNGIWMLHVLLPPQLYHTNTSQSLTTSPRRLKSGAADGSINHHLHHQDSVGGGALGRGASMAPLPPHTQLVSVAHTISNESRAKQEQVTDILSVRARDVTHLRQTVKDLKDHLAKASTTIEYKVYQKEQEVRRAVDSDLVRLRAECAGLREELQRAVTGAAKAHQAAAEDAERARRKAAAAAEAERERLESMIAVEIERTNIAQAEVATLKSKFGHKLNVMNQSKIEEGRAAEEKVAILQSHVGVVQKQAVNTINQAHAKMDHEIRIDSELNELELDRLEATTKTRLDDKEDKYMKLLAQHTMQGGIANQTAAANVELQKNNDSLLKENASLAEQVITLREELTAMHSAWADRDVKQRMTDMEVKELGHQVAQGRLYTQLATGRITELASEIDPLKKSRAESQAQVARLEALQVRQVERQLKVSSEMSLLSAHLTHARAELAACKTAAHQQEAYWANFTTQLFRVIHTVPVDKWAAIFGKLHADFVEGRDRLDWRKYSSTDTGPQAEADQDMTEQELRVQLKEVQAQMLHNERMLAVAHETREKEGTAHRTLVARLQAENVEVLAQLNQTKRELKEANMHLERLRVEMSLRGTSQPPGNTPASRARPDSRGTLGVSAGNPAGAGTSHSSLLVIPESSPRVLWGAHGSPGSRGPPGAPYLAAGGQPVPPGSAPAVSPGSPTRGQRPEHQPADTITGDMPEGGWWLGANSMFEVSSNLSILRASMQAASGTETSSWGGPGSYKLRPSTSDAVTSDGSRAGLKSRDGPGGGAGNFFGHAGRGTSNSAWRGSTPTAEPSRGFTPATPPAPASGSPSRLLFSPPTTAFLSSAAPPPFQQDDAQPGSSGPQLASPRPGKESSQQGGQQVSRTDAQSDQQQAPITSTPTSDSLGIQSLAQGASTLQPGQLSSVRGADGTGAGSAVHGKLSTLDTTAAPVLRPSTREQLQPAVSRTSSIPALSSSMAVPALFNLTGGSRPITPARLTTMGAGFRSFAVRKQG